MQIRFLILCVVFAIPFDQNAFADTGNEPNYAAPIVLSRLQSDYSRSTASGSRVKLNNEDLHNGLAIKVGSGYLVYHPNDSTSPHKINLPASYQSERKLNMEWCAPPYSAWSSQVLYVHTKYGEEQPISLFRNSAVPIFHVLPIIGGDWHADEPQKGLGADFCEYHTSDIDSPRIQTRLGSRLRHWHDTSFWFSNRSTFETVSSVFASEFVNCEARAERLIRIHGGRDEMSWIPITARYKTDSILEVRIVYSGDADAGVAPVPLRYYFLPTVAPRAAK